MDAINKFFSEVVANSLFSMAQLSWSVEGDRALARFTLHEITVEVSFEHRSGAEWQVAFGVRRGKGSDIYAAFQIFNGVFQAVEEFLDNTQRVPPFFRV